MTDCEASEVAPDNDEDRAGNNKERVFVELLISLYREAPELWKVKSQYYYDKSKKTIALTRITNALKALNKNFTENALKKKINALRTSFNREWNKKKKSIWSDPGSDQIYVPKLWYFDRMTFLLESTDVEDAENSAISQDLSEQPDHVPEKNPKRKRKSQSSTSLQSSYSDKSEHEEDTIAKSWAVQLKTLDPDQKRCAMNIINDILFEGEMGTLSESSIMAPVAYLTRKESISSCHRLHSPELSAEENQKIYGKCNNYWGHGHNYTIEVTVRGPIDQKTGMVMNISDLKVHMNEVLMKRLDHKNLDKDVEYFKNVVSTTENLAVYVFNEIKILLPDPSLMYEVKIHETDKNVVIYRGE